MNYPKTRKDKTEDSLFGQMINDPYRWMEDSSEELTTWVEEERKLTEQYLDAIPERKALTRQLSELYDYDKYGMEILPVGDQIIYGVSEGLNNQATYYIKNTVTGEKKVLIAWDYFSNDGSVSVMLGKLSADKKYLGILKSSSGSDWQEIVILNIETGELLDDVIDNAKFSSTEWFGNGFFYNSYDVKGSEKDYTSLNSSQNIYYHKLGTPSSDDILIYADPTNPLRFNHLSVTENEQHLILTIMDGTNGTEVRHMATSDFQFGNNIYQEKENRFGKVDPGFQTIVKGFHSNCHFVGSTDDNIYFLTDENASNKKIFCYNAKDKGWKDVIPESEYFIDHASIKDSTIVLSVSKDAVSSIKIVDLKNATEIMPPMPTMGTVLGISTSDNGFAYYGINSFLFPTHHYKLNLTTGTSEVINKPELNFNPENYCTEQKFFPSKDGTMIPIFLTRKKELPLNGENPLFLYGYGGFSISITPSFSPANIQMLEHNFIYASVCLRGGLEYGEQWHRGGMLENKQNVFDDMIAAAEFVVQKGYTKPEKMAIHGRSNGGVLVGATINQRPDLFAVAIPQVGVMDMLRFHKFTIGWGWIPEYGDPEKEEHFKFIYPYSPLHNIEEKSYPATMVITSDHDDRVVPMHSFKYAATLQEKANKEQPVLLRVTKGAGHGMGNAIRKVVQEKADTLAFILHNIEK